MENKKLKPIKNLDYTNGLIISLISCISIIFIFFLYWRYTSPENTALINKSLLNFAIAVLLGFFASVIFFLIGIQQYFFTRKNQYSNPKKLIYYLKLPLTFKKYKTIFLFSIIGYFIFFGFVSNLFIIINDDQTVFSLFPTFLSSTQYSHEHNSSPQTEDPFYEQNPAHPYSQFYDGLHEFHGPEISSTQQDNSDNNDGNAKSTTIEETRSYPDYRLITCCNKFGYVPMLTIYLSENFSILLIPINFFAGIVISLLVGFNVYMNIYLLSNIKSREKIVSKRGILSGVGITSGLFIGCPTCAGSLFYSIAGFSSLITFSSLSAYQIVFVMISIPLLLISLLVMSKIMQKRFLATCNIR